MPPRFVELSHPIEAGMVTYPGLPVPEVKVIVDYDTSNERYEENRKLVTALRRLDLAQSAPSATKRAA